MKKKFLGIQIYPYSLLMEGAKKVFQRIEELTRPDAVFLSINEVPLRHPIHGGELPHTPGTREYFSDGRYCFRPDPNYYRGTLRPDSCIKEDKDVLAIAVEKGHKIGLRVFAWVQTFNLAPLAAQNPMETARDIEGNPIREWFCPNNPAIIEYNLSVLTDLATSYEIDGIFIDRFRYPSFFDRIPAFFSCFCDRCHHQALRQGYDWTRMRQDVTEIFHRIRTTQSSNIKNMVFTGYGSGADVIQTLMKYPGVLDWMRFRCESIANYVKAAYRHVKNQRDEELEFGLDIWTPSYSWVVGQRYDILTDFCDWVKPICYPGAGPAGVAGEIVHFLDQWCKLTSLESTDAILPVIYRFLGFEFDLPLTEDLLRYKGFPTDLFPLEMARAREKVGSEKPIYAGVPIFDVGTQGVRDRIQMAKTTNIQGILLFCYDWASFKNLKAAGEAFHQ